MYDDVIVILLTLVIKAGFIASWIALFHQMSLFYAHSYTMAKKMERRGAKGKAA